MKIIVVKFLLTYLILCFGCAHRKEQVRMNLQDPPNFVDTLPDPYAKYIPDSLKTYVAIFDSVYKRDQRYRSLKDRRLMFRHEKEQRRLDSLNLMIVADFLDRHGYPSMKQVGIKGMRAINVVIQHAPLAYQEKYFQFVAEAFQKKSIPGETLAMLEDRINMRNRHRQYYGTQLIQVNKTKEYTLYPVVNIDSVNYYRKQIGMNMSVEQYLKIFFKSDWDKEFYLKHVEGSIKELGVKAGPGLHAIIIKAKD